MRNQDGITIRFGVMMKKKSPGMTVKAEEETNVRYFVEKESIEVMATNIKDKERRVSGKSSRPKIDYQRLGKEAG